MDQTIYRQIRKNADMLHFLRQQPVWYRRLSRDPHSFQDFQKELRTFYGRTVPQRIEKFKHQLEMVDFLVALSKAMKD